MSSLAILLLTFLKCFLSLDITVLPVHSTNKILLQSIVTPWSIEIGDSLCIGDRGGGRGREKEGRVGRKLFINYVLSSVLATYQPIIMS